MAVTNAPVNAPVNRFIANLARRFFICSPAAAFKASDICSIPNRKSARPPSSPMAILNTSRLAWLEDTLSAAKHIEMENIMEMMQNNTNWIRRFNAMGSLIIRILLHLELISW